MATTTSLQTLKVGDAAIEIHSCKKTMGKAAAAKAEEILITALAANPVARLIVATGNSQDELIANLVATKGIDWSRIEVFHQDEYLGTSADHPASFRRWLKARFADVVHPGRVYYVAGDAPDTAAECQRYESLLRSAPVDLCLLGFGENGHIAFNDPHVADFHDPLGMKRVALDDRCRAQQVGEGHFKTVDEVPREALTITCSTLMRARNLVCCVPDRRKAEAVQNAFEGPIDTCCPASIVRTHRSSFIFLDVDSAALLNGGRK